MASNPARFLASTCRDFWGKVAAESVWGELSLRRIARASLGNEPRSLMSCSQSGRSRTFKTLALWHLLVYAG